MLLQLDSLQLTSLHSTSSSLSLCLELCCYPVLILPFSITFSFPQTQGDAWFKPAEENVSTGVCLRVEPGIFRVFPYENPSLEPFEASVRELNPEVAVKVRSAAVHAALASL